MIPLTQFVKTIGYTNPRREVQTFKSRGLGSQMAIGFEGPVGAVFTEPPGIYRSDDSSSLTQLSEFPSPGVLRSTPLSRAVTRRTSDAPCDATSLLRPGAEQLRELLNKMEESLEAERLAA